VGPPRAIIRSGTIPSRTVYNNSTRGTEIEYTHNGNGYISTPGSSYPTVISNGPSIFPYTTVIHPTDTPVTIESRPIQQPEKRFSNNSGVQGIQPAASGEIQLSFPRNAEYPLRYSLNGTIYSIKPGYTQTFSHDRNWTIEFIRAGSGGQTARYNLTAGIYEFVRSGSGWELKKTAPADAAELSAPQMPTPLEPKVPAPVPSTDLN
jgi:hypothetical protein